MRGPGARVLGNFPKAEKKNRNPPGELIRVLFLVRLPNIWQG
jgi:hypothetical protein